MQLQEPVTKIRHGLTMPLDKLSVNESLVLRLLLILFVVSLSTHKTWHTWILGRQRGKKRSLEEIASPLSDEQLNNVWGWRNQKFPFGINPLPAARFGKMLRDLREQAGLSPHKLATLLNVDDTTFKKLEAESREPPRDPEFYERLRAVPGFTDSDIAQLLQATGYDPAWLAEINQRKDTKSAPPQTQPVLQVKYVEGLPADGVLAKVKVNDSEYVLGLRSDLAPEVAEAIQAEASEIVAKEAKTQQSSEPRGKVWLATRYPPLDVWFNEDFLTTLKEEAPDILTEFVQTGTLEHASISSPMPHEVVEPGDHLTKHISELQSQATLGSETKQRPAYHSHENVVFHVAQLQAEALGKQETKKGSVKSYEIVASLRDAAERTGVADDEILTTSEIEAEYHINRKLVHEYTKRGRRGRPHLTPLPVRVAGAGGGQLLFRREDIERVVANPPKPGRTSK